MNTLNFIKNTNLNNAWVVEDNMSIYLRKGAHFINGEVAGTIDIANVEVSEDYRNKGIFKEYISYLITILLANTVVVINYTVKYLYIENVLNEMLILALPKLGFTCINNNPPCFFKAL